MALSLYKLEITDGPDVGPVTLTEAKAQCRVETGLTEEDTLLAALIVAAGNFAEGYLGRALITREYTLTTTAGQIVPLPYPPVHTLDSVTAIDKAGVETILAEGTHYRLVDWDGEYVDFLSTPTDAERVEIVYTAGYGDAAGDVPQAIRQAMLLLIAQWYVNREAAAERAQSEVPFAVRALLDNYRVQFTT